MSYTNNNPLVIYHGKCADGFGAAWAVREFYRNNAGHWNDIMPEFYAGTYQQEPPDVTKRDVIIVDFSYKKAMLEQMAYVANKILILDHHESAMEDLSGYRSPGRNWEDHYELMETFDDKVWALFDMERSGAGITWDFFHPGKPRPELINHIEDRDLWRFDLHGTKEIQETVFSYPYDFAVWDHLVEKFDYDSMVLEGRGILRKKMKDTKELLEVAQGKMFLDGYLVPCLNAPYFYASEAGHIMAEPKDVPYAVTYYFTEDSCKLSLRSSKEHGVNVQKIAQKFGGGGHANAAGFEVPLNHDVVQDLVNNN